MRLSEDEVVIAHLSDLHVGSDSDECWNALRTLLTDERPHLLVVTGDLAENPWPSLHGRAKQKLLDLCNLCGIPEIEITARLLIVPGNHDCGIKGNIGLWPLSWWPMWHHFSDWLGKCYALFEDDKIVFFLFDSNPIIYRFATGYISSRVLQKFNRAWTTLQQQIPEFDDFTKIAIVHHHPLPIPYSERLESYLVLRNAGEFIRRLTQKKIDLILHGHKHNQIVSTLNLGTVMSGDRNAIIIGSGATTKRQDTQNECNLIYIGKDRSVQVVHAIRRPGEAFVMAEPRVLPSPEGWAYRSHELLRKKLGYEAEEVHYQISIDEEGDASFKCNTTVRITDRRVFRGISELFASVDRGCIDNFRFNLRKGLVNPEIELRGAPLVREVSVKFPTEPHAWIGEKGLQYEYSYWAFNASARDAADYRWMYPRSLEPPHESTTWTCNAPIKNLRMELHFDEVCGCDSPEILIFRENSEGKEIREPWVEDLYKPKLAYLQDKGAIVLNIERPIPGYKYRIRWNLPQHDINPFEMKVRADVEKIIEVLRRGRAGQVYDRNIETTLRDMILHAERRVRAELNIKPNETIDVSLMTYLGGETMEPEITVIAANRHDIANLRNFTVTWGDGTAGSAWKLGTAQSYLKWEDRADDEKGRPYVPVSDSYHHVALYSVPLPHPREQTLIFGVFNVGSADSGSGLIPHAYLKEVDIINVIGNIAIDFVCPEIFRICGLDYWA